jgi:hypothetical protein
MKKNVKGVFLDVSGIFYRASDFRLGLPLDEHTVQIRHKVGLNEAISCRKSNASVCRKCRRCSCGRAKVARTLLNVWLFKETVQCVAE